MKLIHFGLAGAALQGSGLILFILISRTDIAPVGRAVVIGLTLLSLALLLWNGIKKAKNWVTLLLLPTLLALGYVVAFYAIGFLGFHGLLRDMGFSADYLLSVLRVTAVVFVLYVIGTGLLCFVRKMTDAPSAESLKG